jgi:hypothetical protein
MKQQSGYAQQQLRYVAFQVIAAKINCVIDRVQFKGSDDKGHLNCGYTIVNIFEASNARIFFFFFLVDLLQICTGTEIECNHLQIIRLYATQRSYYIDQ